MILMANLVQNGVERRVFDLPDLGLTHLAGLWADPLNDRHIAVEKAVSCRQHLSRLDDHFNHVLVALRLGSDHGVIIKHEDVHSITIIPGSSLV